MYKFEIWSLIKQMYFYFHMFYLFSYMYHYICEEGVVYMSITDDVSHYYSIVATVKYFTESTVLLYLLCSQVFLSC